MKKILTMILTMALIFTIVPCSTRTVEAASLKKPAKTKITYTKYVGTDNYGRSVVALYYKKLSKNCKYYEIQASRSKSFPNNSNTLKYATPNNSMTKVYLKVTTKSKGNWYIRVRGVNYKSSNSSKKSYGNWSPTKKVYVK